MKKFTVSKKRKETPRGWNAIDVIIVSSKQQTKKLWRRRAETLGVFIRGKKRQETLPGTVVTLGQGKRVGFPPPRV